MDLWQTFVGDKTYGDTNLGNTMFMKVQYSTKLSSSDDARDGEFHAGTWWQLEVSDISLN
jgi:hypothetical protein